MKLVRSAIVIFLGVCTLSGITEGLQTTTTAGTNKEPRRVSCEYAHKDIPSGSKALYDIGDLSNGTINFDSLALMSGVVNNAVDLSEFINTARIAQSRLNNGTNPSKPTESMGKVWNETWYEIALKTEQEAESYYLDGDNVSAAAAHHRAFSYYSLAGRFVPLMTNASLDGYLKSVSNFQKFVSMDNVPGKVSCEPLQIPYNFTAESGRWMQGYLHAYWCPATAPNPQLQKQNNGSTPTVLVLNGYDGLAEWLYEQSAGLANYGFNQLFFDGPGQGWVARVEGQHFIPDYEHVTSAALDFVINRYNIDTKVTYLWGVSFGGYLAPRAFAYEPRFAGLIADGGVYDFYQVMICSWPTDLQELWYSGEPKLWKKLDYIGVEAGQFAMAAFFAQAYGELGFGAKTLTELLSAVEPYTMEGHMHRLADRPIFVLDPAWDGLVGNQSQIFWSHLAAGNRSSMSKLDQPDPNRGEGLHCAIGSTARFLTSVARWLVGVVKSTI